MAAIPRSPSGATSNSDDDVVTNKTIEATIKRSCCLGSIQMLIRTLRFSFPFLLVVHNLKLPPSTINANDAYHGSRRVDEQLTLNETTIIIKPISSAWDQGPLYIPANISESSDGGVAPRNLRVAFIGDSVTRFQYFSLAYFLRHGVWAHNDEQQQFSLEARTLLFARNRQPWEEWLDRTHRALMPNENWDCRYKYYSSKKNRSLHPYERVVENRYFYDPDRGNALYFFLKYGDAKSRSRYSIEQVNLRELPEILQNGTQYQDTSYPAVEQEEESNWVELIHRVARLDPPPHFVVFNAGLHPSRQLLDLAVQTAIVEAFRLTNLTPIYRTTTFPRGRRDRKRNQATPQAKPHEALFCGQLFPHCMNVSWSCNLPDNVYLDKHHLAPKVNSAFNLQLLHYLRAHFTTAKRTNKWMSTAGNEWLFGNHE